MLTFYNSVQQNAAIGNLTPTTVTTTSSYNPGTLGSWTNIVARNDLLLFYNRITRAAAIGVLAQAGLSTTSSYNPGTFGEWTHMVNAAPGVVFYNRMTGAAAVGTFDTKTFTTTGELPAGSLGGWTHLIANGNILLFYDRLSGGAAIATVTPTGLTTNTSYGPASFATWTHVVNDGSTVLFYNRDSGAGAVGTLTPNGFTTKTIYNPGSFGHWTHLSAEGSTVLFYNQDTGGAAIGTLTPDALTSTGYYQPGAFSRWTHVIGRSSGGPEEQELKIAVLLCHWKRPPSSSTVLPADFYRRYFFDLNAEDGIGRYWFMESGGQLRLTGNVNDWISLSKAPLDPSINPKQEKIRQPLAQLAISDAMKAGWGPGDADAIIAVIACDGSAGVGAGSIGQELTIEGRKRSVIVLHGDSRNWILRSNGNVLGSDYRFDFSAHEVGHIIGDYYSFNHAFGPAGPYDHPYCIMAAASYGRLGQQVTYDRWSTDSQRLPEEHTKGPGLAGATRAACGWARVRRVTAAQLKQGIELHLAHLGDSTTSLPQVIECAAKMPNGSAATFTVEFRSPLAEHDQALRPTVVLNQREGSNWSPNGTWAKRSATLRTDAVIPSSNLLPSVTEPGILRVDVLEMASAETINNLSGPPWIRIRISGWTT